MSYRTFPFLIVFAFVLSNSCFSQEIIYSNDSDKTETTQESDNVSNNFIEKEKKSDPKVKYNIEMGSSVSTSKSFGNSLSFYTAPQIQYRLAPKLSISAGVMFINTSISNYYLAENQRKQNFNQAYLFGGFNYDATKKLRLSGEVLYGMTKSPYQITNNGNKQDYFVKFSAEYKINESLSIGLQIINQNMGYRGFGNSYGYDPFSNGLYNPFGR